MEDQNNLNSWPYEKIALQNFTGQFWHTQKGDIIILNCFTQSVPYDVLDIIN